MPIFQHPDYTPPAFLFNGHLQTIIPSQLRIVRGVQYERDRIKTTDDDFLLLDWSGKQADRLAIISHGLEGDSHRPYMRGMVRAFNRAGYDALAWNFRGCGGEINHTLRFYHSGATADLDLIIRFVLDRFQYQEIVLVGFSLGGNLTLKYIGENGKNLLPSISKAVVFSVPLDLGSCARKIAHSSNFIYHWRFLRQLKKKIREKARRMPLKLSTEHLKKIKTLIEFDDFYTAPLHGFESAEDYYARCSSLYYLQHIQIPTLIVNALNDPFLSEKCFFQQHTLPSEQLYFAAPAEGGHCGFMQKNARSEDNFWSEDIAIKFANGEF